MILFRDSSAIILTSASASSHNANNVLIEQPKICGYLEINFVFGEHNPSVIIIQCDIFSFLLSLTTQIV